MPISLLSQRVLHESADVSTALNDYRTGTYAMVYVAGQHLHVGSLTPFNNLWFQMQTPAHPGASGFPVIEVRWGNAWQPVVDIIDQTQGLHVSGRISWTLDIDKGWDVERRSDEDAGIAGTKIYNLYWLRISWPNTFNATIAYLGQKFSSDDVLQSVYPDLLQPAILAGFEAGKTDWNEQHFLAAEFIVKDLKARQFIIDKGQIFDWSILESAATHKVAAIIYGSFGAAYVDHAARAEKAYQDEMKMRLMPFDKSTDGHLSEYEKTQTEQWMTR